MDGHPFVFPAFAASSFLGISVGLRTAFPSHLEHEVCLLASATKNPSRVFQIPSILALVHHAPLVLRGSFQCRWTVSLVSTLRWGLCVVARALWGVGVWGQAAIPQQGV